MPTTIKLKNSVTTTNAPTSLVQGEVAINITDKKVWVGDAATTPIQLLGAGASGSFGALSCTSLTNSGLTATRVTYATTAGLLTDSANLTFNGTTLTAGGLTTTGATSTGTLTATGVATFSAGTVSAPAITTTGDTNTGIFFPAADTIAFTEGGAEAMRIDSSGNVGIGMTPVYKLDVTGGNGNAIRYTNSADGVQVALGAFNSTGFFGTLNNFPQLFYTNAAERMRIDSSGNVGIGTSSPSARLDVRAGASALVGNFQSNTGVAAYIAVGDGTVTGYLQGDANQSTVKVGSLTNYPLLFQTNNTERMRITSGGDLLVGDSSTGYTAKFAVKKSGTTGSVVAFYGTAASDQAMAGLVVAKFSNDSTTSQIFHKFTINNDGAGCGQINGNGASQAAFGSFSDIRLKENIVDLPPQLDNILALRPVEFDYIQSEGGGHQVSFIAQEFEQVYPDAIGERSDGMKTLTGWGKTEARLVKAIQELHEIVKAQAAEIALLKSK